MMNKRMTEHFFFFEISSKQQEIQKNKWEILEKDVFVEKKTFFPRKNKFEKKTNGKKDVQKQEKKNQRGFT